MKRYLLSAAFVFIGSFFISSSCAAVATVTGAGFGAQWNDSDSGDYIAVAGSITFSEAAIATIIIDEVGSNLGQLIVGCGGTTGCGFNQIVPGDPSLHNSQWRIVNVELRSQIDNAVTNSGPYGDTLTIRDETMPRANFLGFTVNSTPTNTIDTSNGSIDMQMLTEIIDYGTGGYPDFSTLTLPSGEIIPASSINTVQSIDGGVEAAVNFLIPQGREVGQGDILFRYRNGAEMTLTDSAFASIAFVDQTHPVLTEVVPVPTSTNINTPSYTFHTSEQVSFSLSGERCLASMCDIEEGVGSCLGYPLAIIPAGNFTVDFWEMADDTYDDCTVSVNDMSGNDANLLISAFTIDTTAPIITEVTPIPPVTDDNTPSYVFNLSEDAEVSVAGKGCVVAESPMQVSAGEHTITFSELDDGLYEYCEIWAEDYLGNRSNHAIPDFMINAILDDEDVIKPILVDLSLSTNNIDTTSEDQEVVVTFTATDDLSGVCVDEEECEDPTYAFFEDDYDHDYFVNDLEKIGEDQYSGVVTFPQSAAAGLYDFTLVLQDKIGNAKVFESHEGGGVIWEDGDLVLFDEDDFTVTNNPNPLEDIAVPILEGDPIVEPFTINASDESQVVTVTFSALDDISGVCVKSENPNCDTKVYFGNFLVEEVERISGTNTNGTYRAEFTVPRYGTLEELEITIEDHVGNEKDEYEYELSDGLWENITDPVDVEGPQVVDDFAVSPSEIDTSKGPQTVLVTFTAEDDLSGVCEGTSEDCHVKVLLGDDRNWWSSGNYVGYAEKVSGNALNGVYEAEITFPQYAQLGSYNLYYSLSDNVGNKDEDAEDFELEDVVSNYVGAGSDNGDDEEEDDSNKTDPVIGSNEKGEVNIPKPDLSLSGKMKDLVLSSKKKIYIKTDEIKFKGEFKDLAGGKVEIKYKRGSKSDTEETDIDENGEWSEKVKFKKDGSYKIKFTFFDKDGKEIGKKGYYKVKIDTEDPAIADMPARLTKRVGDKLWWDATDDEGIDKYKYILNGKKTKTKDPFFHIPAGTPPGVYDIEIRAYDDAGNKDVRNVLVTVR